MLLQTLFTTTPTVKAIERAAKLYALYLGTEGEESHAALGVFDKECEAHRLTLFGLNAFAPPSARITDAGELVAESVPYWRGIVLLSCLAFAGFSGKAPWIVLDSKPKAIVGEALGTVLAATRARAMYADSAVRIASEARRYARWSVRKDALFMFALGASVGLARELEAEKQKRVQEESRFAMIVRPKDQPVTAAEMTADSVFKAGVETGAGMARAVWHERREPARAPTRKALELSILFGIDLSVPFGGRSGFNGPW